MVINENINIASIRELWNNTFGNISETNRCDNLAMMIGFIVSTSTGNFTLFDKRYNRLQSNLSQAGEQPTHDQCVLIYTKLWEFLDTIRQIEILSIFGKTTKGFPPQTKIAPVWKSICEGTFTGKNKTDMIKFYNTVNRDSNQRKQYLDLFKGSNSETGNAKIQNIVDYVLGTFEI